MAKRGYRGKHPHNDMKVSKTPSKNKYSTKLTKEYNKLGSKQKYSYIRTNYFYPQAALTISGTVNFNANSTVTMSAHDGTLLIMSGSTTEDATGGANSSAFKANGNSLQNAQSIRDIVNTNMAGKITASISSVALGTATTNDAIVKLEMVEPGPDGNTSLTVHESGAKVIDEGVTFNGAAANSSGSGFTFTGG